MVKEFLRSSAARQKHNYIDGTWHFPAERLLPGSVQEQRGAISSKNQSDNYRQRCRATMSFQAIPRNVALGDPAKELASGFGAVFFLLEGKL